MHPPLVHISHLEKSTPRTCDTPGPWLRLVWNTTPSGVNSGIDRLITRDNVVQPRFSVRCAAISPRYTPIPISASRDAYQEIGHRSDQNVFRPIGWRTMNHSWRGVSRLFFQRTWSTSWNLTVQRDIFNRRLEIKFNWFKSCWQSCRWRVGFVLTQFFDLYY